jgi:hypothetical protein
MWRRAGAHIVSEAIQGEVIIVNLLEGVYFSIPGSGAHIWEYISNGYSIEMIAESLRTEFSNLPDDVTDKITNFVAKLSEEQLIQHCNGAPQSIDQTATANSFRSAFRKQTSLANDA